jgi:hypothetical protein
MAMAALAGIGGALLGGISQQSRSPVATQQSRQDTSTAAIALSKDPKAAKLARKNAQEERLMALLTDPQIMGLLTVLGGLYVSNKIPWTEDPGARARISGVAAAACVVMGLGRAGVGDMTTLAVATVAGAATASSGSGGISDLIPSKIPGTDLPWYALTPAGGLYEVIKRYI